MKVQKFYDLRGIPFCYVWGDSVFLIDFGQYIYELINEHGLELRSLVDFDYRLFLFDRFGIRDCSLPKNALDIEILKKLLANKVIP